MSFIPADYSQIQKQIKAEKESSYWGGYYKPGVYGGTPTQKKSFSGRILPAFNYNLSQADSDFPTSWMPYRNVDNVDPETNQPVLSAFFAVVAAYSWFGNKQVSFLSPSTLRFTQSISRGPELIDPVQDIRNYAKKHEDPAIRALTERPENKKDAKIVIPYAQRRYVFNFFGTAGIDRNIRNYLVDVSQKAFEDLATKLSEWRPAHEQILDKNWPNYLYGDITDPQNGIMVDTLSIPSNPQPFNGFAFTSGSHKSLKGIRQQPVPMEALAGRYHLYGPQSVFKIMSVQEIVDFLVDDGAIPHHLIEEVCSNYARVPAAPSRATVFPGASNDEEEANAYVPPSPFSAPKEPSHKQADAQPPAYRQPAPPPSMPAARPATKYWVVMNDNPDSELYTREEVQDIIMRNAGSRFMLCESDGSTWRDPLELDFSVPPAPTTPPPMPKVSDRPTPPPMPPAASQSAPPMVQTPKPVSAAGNISAEDMEKYKELKAMFENGTLPPKDLAAFVKLVNMIEAKP